MHYGPLIRAFAMMAVTLVLTAQTTRRIVRVDSAAQQTFERQPKIAVLVGIGAYPEGSGLGPLKYAGSDVRELAAELEKDGYAVRQLADAQATRGVIVRTLSQIGEALDSGQGTLVFYFSGHGFTQNGINYLATYGTSVDDLQRDGLALTEVEQLVKRSRAKRQVLWIDACRNDPQAGARDVALRSFAKLDAAEGLRVLYSTRAGSVSYEDDSLQHGVFTHFLLRGLRGDAAGTDGLVTFQDLAGYVAESVMSYGVKTGRVQRPFEAGEASGDFLMAELSAPVRTANVAPSSSAVASPALTAGAMKVNPKDGLTYIWVPPGRFKMGCAPGDLLCYGQESPAHEVQLTKGFWIGQTEVPQEAFQRLMGANPSYFKGAKLPVETISWDEAGAYCEAVGMRLPTEAEWEYAARAGNSGVLYGALDGVAWHGGNSGTRTHEVAQKMPNKLGLYDVLGNVREWVSDWSAQFESHVEQDPRGPTNGSQRMTRGASWNLGSTSARLSYRWGESPGNRYSDVGVRCAGDE